MIYKNFTHMTKAITLGVEISVETMYMANQSNPREGHYFFMYDIIIQNKSDYTIQLTKRHWNIFDSTGEYRTVSGEGVVGECPVIEPGEKFRYSSGCNFASEIGKMYGYYTAKRLFDNKEFHVSIPEFHLITPGKLN